MTKNAKSLIASVLVFWFSIYALGYLGFYEIEAWWVLPTVGLLALFLIGSFVSIIACLFWLAEGRHADD